MIHICVPGLPPTVNHAYGRTKGGKRYLKKEGEKYKNETKTYIARHYPQELKFFSRNRPYTMLAEITFPERSDLLCGTYPEKTDSRFQKLDVSNRTKLFEDAVAEALGIDDSATFFFGISKRWSTGIGEMDLWAWDRELERDPISELLRDLRAACAQPH